MIWEEEVSVGAFLQKGVDFKNGDTLTIASEGQKQVEGKYGKQDLFLFRTKDGKEGNLSINKTTKNNLIKGYGKESLNWVGKDVKVVSMQAMKDGKVQTHYFYFHPETVFNEVTSKYEIPEKDAFDQFEEDNKVVNDINTDTLIDKIPS